MKPHRGDCGWRPMVRASACSTKPLHLKGCSRSDWAQTLADAEVQHDPIFINVGANKGYKIAAFMALWSQHFTTGQMWKKRILQYAAHISSGHLHSVSCGVCHDCHEPPPRQHGRTGGQTHALELDSSNRRLLRHLIESFGMDASVRVHDLAASNSTGVVATAPLLNPRTNKSLVGYEGHAICTASSCRHRQLEYTRATTLDEFASAHRLRHLYQLSIDAEGWDAVILEGARGLLRSRAISLVEFEFSARKGFWSAAAGADQRTLEHTLLWLGSFGYSCFWIVPDGLARASPPCWQPAFEQTRWSNLLCAHEPKILRRLETLIAQRQTPPRRSSGRPLGANL